MGEWNDLKLGDTGKIITGKTPSKDAPEDWGDFMPFVTPTDYGNYRKKAFFAKRRLSKIGADRLSNKILPTNSLMVTCIGSDMGRVAMNALPVITNQQINAIIPKLDVVDPDFLYYRLVSIYDILRTYGGDGTAVPIVNKGDFGSIETSFPKRVEQKAIAEVLASLDDKIDLLHRQNKTLEALAETLFRQWFVDGAASTWKTERVGDVVKTNALTIKGDYTQQNIKYLDTGSITEGKIEAFQTYNLKDAPSRAKRLVQHNDIIISTVRPNHKHYGFIKNPSDDLVVSTGFCVLTCTDIDPHFLYLLLTQQEMTEYFGVLAEASTSTYPSLKPSDIEAVEFQRPPEKLLKEFSAVASDSWEKIEANYTQIRNLEKNRDTLLPKLMSGEVRVKYGEAA